MVPPSPRYTTILSPRIGSESLQAFEGRPTAPQCNPEIKMSGWMGPYRHLCAKNILFPGLALLFRAGRARSEAMEAKK